MDGKAPGGQVVAAFGMPVEVESAGGRLGEVAYPRLASSVPDPNAGALLDTYDLALPATSYEPGRGAAGYHAEPGPPPPAVQGIVLSPARLTALTVVMIVLLAVAFGSGLLVGRFAF